MVGHEEMLHGDIMFCVIEWNALEADKCYPFFVKFQNVRVPLRMRMCLWPVTPFLFVTG